MWNGLKEPTHKWHNQARLTILHSIQIHSPIESDCSLSKTELVHGDKHCHMHLLHQSSEFPRHNHIVNLCEHATQEINKGTPKSFLILIGWFARFLSITCVLCAEPVQLCSNQFHSLLSISWSVCATGAGSVFD
mmetsp:Transcript_7590/g.28482  ORF Transcript_7590/g.28482 Transcript_7590/m.28482 type:complete len:134 (+) Transcript_7590:717-1118(+)